MVACVKTLLVSAELNNLIPIVPLSLLVYKKTIIKKDNQE